MLSGCLILSQSRHQLERTACHCKISVPNIHANLTQYVVAESYLSSLIAQSSSLLNCEVRVRVPRGVQWPSASDKPAGLAWQDRQPYPVGA